MFNNFKYFLLAILSYCAVCNSTEFVPVFMWETQDSIESSPALQRISESSFKDILLEKLKSNPQVIVFAEETLSPEDFAQHDEHGKTLFPTLHKLLGKANVAYKPYVQNPIGAIKQLDTGVTEVSIASLLRDFNVPTDEILIVDLNDARDDEQRSGMLKRHDSAISTLFDKLRDTTNKDILAIYTAHHTSWITPEATKHRNARSLLQDNEVTEKPKETKPKEFTADKPKTKSNQTGTLIIDDNVLLLHVSSTPLQSEDGGVKFTPIELTSSPCKDEGKNITCELSGNGQKFELKVVIQKSGYWEVTNLTSEGVKSNFTEISVPLGFSYHCNNVSFTFTAKKILLLPGLQIQPFTNKTDVGQVFGDPYDCVGFTSIPIWTGMLVTLILLLILTFGITLMMDIKTMDKFDDAKGKTITINAAE